MFNALELSKKRILKETTTKEKILRGELSLDFYNLRPTLANEQVVYYENEDELEKSC